MSANRGLSDRSGTTSTQSTNAGVRFGYRAANAAGALEEGEVDATSEQDAVDTLRRRALWATEVWPKQSPRKIKRSRGTPAGALARDTRTFATLLTSGVPLEQALNYVAQHSLAAELRDGFSAVRTRVQSGVALSDALRLERVFPAMFPALAATGEATGTLDASLSRLADHLERADELRARLRAALLYPALLGVAAIVGVSVIMLVVVPRFAVLLQQAGGKLPLSTRLLMAVRNTFTVGWPAMLALAIGGALGWRQWIARPASRRQFHGARLRWPLVGDYERALAAARYTRTLAMALPSGVDLLAAMKLARGTVENLALAHQLEESEAAVRNGAALAASVANVLPPLAVQLLGAGEASGALAALSGRAADALEAETQRELANAVTLIEPILILGFGGLIGFVALGLLQAIYGINASTL
ncbi:MAG: type II secretion system F family protein [Gemmatimonas sp.]